MKRRAYYLGGQVNIEPIPAFDHASTFGRLVERRRYFEVLQYSQLARKRRINTAATYSGAFCENDTSVDLAIIKDKQSRFKTLDGVYAGHCYEEELESKFWGVTANLTLLYTFGYYVNQAPHFGSQS